MSMADELSSALRWYSIRHSSGTDVVSIRTEQKMAAVAASSTSAASGRYVAVLDFEKSLKEIVSDRSQLDKTFPCKIIEFPTVLVDLESGTILDEIVHTVKPNAKMVEWERYSPLLATCGDMDMQTSFVQQLDHEAAALKQGLDAVDIAECWASLQSVGGHKWCNIKTYFQTALGADWQQALPWFDEAKGVRERLTQESMLAACNVEAEGHHHRGIDDCRNLAKLMVRLFERSSQLPQATGELKAKSIKALKAR